MNLPRLQKRILLYVILPACVFYLGLRLYAQYRYADLYVSSTAPMPKELSSGLHRQERGIDRMVTRETPYDHAEDKKLPLEEITRLRSQIAWTRAMPPFIDSLTIQSPTGVLGRRTTRHVMMEYQIVKRDERWLIESMIRSEIQPRPD